MTCSRGNYPLVSNTCVTNFFENEWGVYICIYVSMCTYTLTLKQV